MWSCCVSGSGAGSLVRGWTLSWLGSGGGSLLALSCWLAASETVGVAMALLVADPEVEFCRIRAFVHISCWLAACATGGVTLPLLGADPEVVFSRIRAFGHSKI